MVCVISANGRRQYGALYEIIGKDANGQTVYDDIYCCTTPAIRAEARLIMEEEENVFRVQIIPLDIGERGEVREELTREEIQ